MEIRMNWKDYQNEAAEVFRKAGCEAEVDVVVEGVRGEHGIDVFVTFEQYGINCSWVVECKYWNTNVPKEKVLALQAIVDDVGADRGVLISKTGFQSGAIRLAQKSNITLTSLENLAEDLKKDSTKITIETLETNLLKVTHQIFALLKTEDGNWDHSYYTEGVSVQETMAHGGRVCLLETGFTNIKLGKKRYLVRFTAQGNKIESTDSIEEFLEAVNNQISISTLWLNSISSLKS